MNKLTITEQDLRLAAVYLKMNDKGRDVLDLVIQKLAEKKQIPSGEKRKDGFLGKEKSEELPGIL